MSQLRNAACVALLLTLALASTSASSEGLAKGNSILSFQLTTGVADLATIEDDGFITAYDHSEWGGQVQFQHLMSDEWALALSAGVGTFKETNEAGTNAPLAGDRVYKQSSLQFRVGADRFVHLSPTFHLFMGPGIQYWSGKAKFEDGTIERESQRTKRIALNGRMGANIALGDSFGLEGHIGHYFGFANAKDTGARASWTPSGLESAAGFAFKF